MTEYSSHDWRKNTDDAVVVASDIGIKLEVNKSKVIFSVQVHIESIALNLGGMNIYNLVHIEDSNED